MKRWEILLGIGLAVILALGVVLTRGGGGDDALAIAVDISEADGEFRVGDVTVAVTAEPRPLRVLDRLRFALRFTREGEALTVTAPRVDFGMEMDMGPHGYQLVHEASDAWVAEGVVLPQCGSGSRLWFADLAFEVEGKPLAARLRLDLHPPRGD